MSSRSFILAFIALLALGASAQEIPALVVTPTRAQVTLYQSRPFRAVDRLGLPDNTVRWMTNSSHAEVEGDGAEVTVYFDAPGEYIIHAYGTDGEASATVRVVRLRQIPPGEEKWAVAELPGCKTVDIIPAIPAPESTNDVFAKEVCPGGGTVIRAYTVDGLENWRTWISPGQHIDEKNLGKYQPKSLIGPSFCDKLKRGMTKKETEDLATGTSLRLPADRAKDMWVFDEDTSECRVTFAEDVIVKKQKIIGN